MDLKNYFETYDGTGILSTADTAGRVDAAIYARPHVLHDGTVAMIMLDRLTHKNLQENPYAVYLFMEQGSGYSGIRMFLKKVREDDDQQLINSMSRRNLSSEEEGTHGDKFIVYFEVEKTLKLVGSELA